MSDSQVLPRETISGDVDAVADADGSETFERESREWTNDHGINIRLTIPLFIRTYYFTIVAGAERRKPKRRTEERTKHPLWTVRNVSFIAIIGIYIWFYWEMLIKLFSVLS